MNFFRSLLCALRVVALLQRGRAVAQRLAASTCAAATRQHGHLSIYTKPQSRSWRPTRCPPRPSRHWTAAPAAQHYVNSTRQRAPSNTERPTDAHLLLQHKLAASRRHILPLLLPHRARQAVLLQHGLEHEGGVRRRRPEVKIGAENRVPRDEVDGDVAAAQQLPQLVRVALEAVEVGA